MNRIRRSYLVLLCTALALLSIGPVKGIASAKQGPLVSVDWLSRHMKDRNLVILDVRTFPKYEKSHIPGAVKAFGPWERMNDKFVGFMMPKTSELENMLRKYGINNKSFVVCYDAGLTSSDTAKSARAVWTLQVLGHNKVAILDGGFEAWGQAEKPVTSEPTVPWPGNFKAHVDRSKVATLDEVRKVIGSRKVFLVDNRLPEYYFGHEKKSEVKRFGRLPGSILLPVSFVTTGGQEFSPAIMRPVKELQQMALGVGLPKDRSVRIITYSDHGTQAALGYFVLHNILGYKNVSVYDGSIIEAAANPKVRMERYSWSYGSYGGR